MGARCNAARTCARRARTPMLDAAGTFERGLEDGLAEYERDILAHWDAGQSIDAICAATGRPKSTVRLVTKLYDDRPEMGCDLVATNDRHVAAIARLRARMNGPTMSVDEIVDMLTDRIESLVKDLLPNAYEEGNEMCVGNLAGDPGQSLRIHVGSGARRGWWKDFLAPTGTREGGNPLWLIAEVLFAGDVKQAVQWAKGWLHIDDSDPARLQQFRLESQGRRAERDAQAEADAAKKTKNAQRRYHQAQPLRIGDPVHHYLSAGRAIDFDALGRFPGAIRYHEALQYGWPAQGEAPLLLPAMVAMITSLAGQHIATHRTWLDVARNRKAGGDLLGFNRRGEPNDPKKVMGTYLGGHIPVWKGAHSCPLRDIPAGTDVYASEGVEDGLTVASADPSLRVIAMIALGNLMALELPPQMGRLIILKQNDPPGSEADQMLMRGVTAQRARGRKVLFCPAPRGVKDINELAQIAQREGM